MKNKRTGKILIVIGIILLLLGMFFFFYNLYEDYKAGKKSKTILIDIKEYINEDNDKNEDNKQNSSSLMPVKFIDGYGYIGYITIPSIKIELPVMDEWSYKKLKISPCRHFGSIEDNNLVIAAHAYRSHFKNISKLNKGDVITITDVEGNKYTYQVIKKATLEPSEVDIVQNSGYDLVLYTCTSEGSKRITVFCRRI